MYRDSKIGVMFCSRTVSQMDSQVHAHRTHRIDSPPMCTTYHNHNK